MRKEQREKEERPHQAIIRLIKKENPENTEKLVGFLKEELKLPEQKIINQLLNLENEGKITFKHQLPQGQKNISSYIKTGGALWYWITMALAITAALTAFTVPENAFPIVYLRYALGSIFVLWLPGYTLLKILFPTKELDGTERTSLSIGLSLAIVPMVGLLLNYTPWGIRPSSVTLSVLSLTIIFATVAVLREHQTKHNKTQGNKTIRVRGCTTRQHSVGGEKQIE